MDRKKKKKPLLGIVYGVILTAFTAYALLDTFVIPRSYAVVAGTSASANSTAVSSATVTSDQSAGVSGNSSDQSTDQSAGGSGNSTAASASSTAATVTDTSYSDGSITVTIKTYRENDTNIYVADVQLASLDSLKTAFANGTYGRNIKATTSSIAESVNAILAINGDFYGSQESGYVIRNGVLYRDTSAGSGQEDLVIYSDGTFGIIDEGEVTAQELIDKGAYQVLSFGPAIVENSEVSVTADEEVGKAMASNPRTAIGIIDSLHYVFVVSDGRTSESAGLTLPELGTFMQSLGVTTAYNLDGGGSSTMVFNGTVINQPTTDGNTIKERSVSDIVYIG